ncbi:MAG: PorT family protein [Candidatus Symbiothrix sp.]|jgi:hypothetical protein|nr:PorT family protein [Candidatus Symbiothrix sp.]
MKRIIVLIFIGLHLFLLGSNAQEAWEYKILGGYNLGGSSPLPLPAEIRAIEQYSPKAFAPHIAVEVTRWLNEKWGISAQIALDSKGFTVRDQVKSLYTEIRIDGNPDPQTGNFTGKNTTEIRNSYFTVPVMATYRGSEHWLTQLGIYTAYLYHPHFSGTASDGYIRRESPIGEKIDVPHASFDFSKEQNRFDYGFVLAEEWRFCKKFALRGEINWGVRSLFPADFTGMAFNMYNIYGMIGVSYSVTVK